jgi:para-aminobenzoate synthetase
MNDVDEKTLIQARKIAAQIRDLLARKGPPVVVALDGGSGAGKSTIAAMIAKGTDAALIPLDDFFSADIPDSQWDEFTIEEKLEYVFGWERLRQQVIEPLLQGRPARWHSFDFQSGLRADGTYGMETEPRERMPARVILIEGAYSSSPKLADLVDVAILVDVPIEERHARLAAREDPDFLKTWHRRWDEVEAYYFEKMRPKSSFAIVVELHSAA